jgi:hypothetical protein
MVNAKTSLMPTQIPLRVLYFPGKLLLTNPLGTLAGEGSGRNFRVLKLRSVRVKDIRTKNRHITYIMATTLINTSRALIWPSVWPFSFCNLTPLFRIAPK